MRTQRVTVAPTLSLKKQCDYTGRLVKCVSGAHPSMRIFFEDPGLENFSGQSGRVLRNGAVYQCDDGDVFNSFWLRAQTLQGPAVSSQEMLVLEVIDCADPVYVLNDNVGAGWKFHWIGGATDVTNHAIDAQFDLFIDNAWGSTGIIDDPLTADFIPRGFIGGGVQADQPFTVHLLQHLTKNATRKVELARWVANAATANTGTDWQYGVSFETNGANQTDSGLSNTKGGATLLPWPLFGLTISIHVGAAAINSLTWLLYSRGQCM